MLITHFLKVAYNLELDKNKRLLISIAKFGYSKVLFFTIYSMNVFDCIIVAKLEERPTRKYSRSFHL